MHYLLAVMVPSAVLEIDSDAVDEYVHGVMAPYDVERDNAPDPDEIDPDGRWDWYQIGGRWDGAFAMDEPQPAAAVPAGVTSDEVARNLISAENWNRRLEHGGPVTHALLDNRGQWHEAAGNDDDWRDALTALVNRHVGTDHFALIVDYHY